VINDSCQALLLMAKHQFTSCITPHCHNMHALGLVSKIFNVSIFQNNKCYCEVHGDVVIRVGHQGVISKIDTSSVVDETESAKVTTESHMADCSTELMRRPETTDGR